jgi:nicotinamidase-related amidase
MNEIVYLRALFDPSTAPCLVLIDLQREYLAQARLISLPDAQAALENCRAALGYARSRGLPIAFLRQISRSAFFNPSTAFSGWIEGFEPHGADMVFERNRPSGYANKQFAELMDGSGGHFVFGGFAGETACLSTAIDAFHRKHCFAYLTDASASHAVGDLSAAETHRAISQVIAVYGPVLTTQSWIDGHLHREWASYGMSDERQKR